MSHGLRHAPKAIDWVVGWQPNSGNAVLPTVTTPAARKRAPRIVSEGARQSSDRNSPLPMYRGRPARQAPTSLSRNGTPWNGPRGSAESAAMARPTSGSGTTTAFSTGLAASMRVIALSASSAGVTSPSATRSRRATASSHPRSLADTGGAYAIQHEHLVQTGDVQHQVRLVLRCDVQRPRSPFEPLARNNYVFNWTVPFIPTVKPFTSRPLRCWTVSAPESGSSTGTLRAAGRKRRPGGVRLAPCWEKLGRWSRGWPKRPVR